MVINHFRMAFGRGEVSSLTREDSVKAVVWTGLDQLSQVVDMFSPVIQTIILPSQLDPQTLIASQTSSGLFNKGEGINVFAEELYRIKIYFESVDQYLRYNNTRLDVKVNVENVCKIGDNLVNGILSAEQGLFRGSRRKREVEAIGSFQSLLLLLLRHQLDQDQRKEHGDKIKLLLHDLAKYSLWKPSSNQ